MIATILDTETNGLIDNHSVKIERQPSIIEYYARTTDLATGEVLGEYETLVKPPKPLSQEIVDITGITDDILKDAPPFAEVADKIRENVENSQIIIAHNMSFDKEVTDIEFERLSQSLNWPRLICTVEATIYIKGYRMRLPDLYEYLFNEKITDHHRARADVDKLERICIELFNRGDL